MEKKLKKSLISVIIILSVALITVTFFYLKTVQSYNEKNIDVDKKQKEINARDSIINKYKLINDSILKHTYNMESQIDSLKHVKHIIYVTPTEQISSNTDEAFKEMIKELNKYRNEKIK